MFFAIFFGLGLVTPTAYGDQFSLGRLIDAAKEQAEDQAIGFQDKLFVNFRDFNVDMLPRDGRFADPIDPHLITIRTVGDVFNPGLIFMVNRSVEPLNHFLSFQFNYDVRTFHGEKLIHDGSLSIQSSNVAGTGSVQVDSSFMFDPILPPGNFLNVSATTGGQQLFDETSFSLVNFVSSNVQVDISAGDGGAFLGSFEQRFSQEIPIAQAAEPSTGLLLGSALLGMILWQGRKRGTATVFDVKSRIGRWTKGVGSLLLMSIPTAARSAINGAESVRHRCPSTV